MHDNQTPPSDPPDHRITELVAEYMEARFQRDYAIGRCAALASDIRAELLAAYLNEMSRRPRPWWRPVTMNGWALAPHCWKHFLTRPVRVEKVPGYWTSVSLLGFTFFFEETPP